MREFNFFGIFMSPMVAYLAIAIVLYVLARRWISQAWIERYFWHPKLVQFCLFMIILSLVVFVALV